MCPLPLQLLSKNHLFLIFWNGVDLPPSYLDNVFKYTVFFLTAPLRVCVWSHEYFFLIQKLSCTAKVSSSTILLDVCYMECSLSCGKDENCGAYFVKEESGYQCFLIELDDDGNYKNRASLVDSTSVKYYYSMSDYE